MARSRSLRDVIFSGSTTLTFQGSAQDLRAGRSWVLMADLLTKPTRAVPVFAHGGTERTDAPHAGHDNPHRSPRKGARVHARACFARGRLQLRSPRQAPAGPEHRAREPPEH